MGRLRQRWQPLSVLGVILLCCLWHLWWLHRFRAGFPLDIDESRYIQHGLALKDGLAHSGPRGMWHVWAGQHDFGPLLPLTSVPVYVGLGESLMNAFATQLIFFAVLVLTSYGIGSRLSSRNGGALVALVVATTPAVIDFTRSYQFAVTGAALLAACTYALLASEALSRRGFALAWGVLLGLMPLARTMLVAFVPAQLIAAAWLVFARPGPRRPRAVNLAAAVAAGAAVASVWLASSFHAVAHYLTSFGLGAQSAQFGTSRSRLAFGYWTRELVNTVKAELYLPLAALLVAALVLGVAALAMGLRRSRTDPRAWARGWVLSDGAVVLFVLLEAYLALTVTRNEGVGFRVPVIPLLVALAVAAIWRLPWRLARAGLVTGLAAVAALNVVAKTDALSALSRDRSLHLPALGATPVVVGDGYIQGYVLGSFETVSPSPTHPLPDSQKGWLPAYQRIVSRVRTLAPSPGSARVVGLATSEPLVNANNLTLAARLRFHEDLPVRVLGFPSGTVTSASYRHLLEGAQAPNVLVTVSRLGLNYVALTGGVAVDQSVIRRTARSLGFRPAGAVSLPDARRAFVWWRPR